MSTRRPPPSVDTERFMQRVEGRIDRAFGVILKEIGEVRQQIDTTSFEVRKGNLNTELLTKRVTDLENQVLETRSHFQIAGIEGAKAAEAVAETAVTAAKAAPKNVWKTKLGMITAGSAAFVAVVAFFNNLPKFVRGAAEMATSLFSFIVRHR